MEATETMPAPKRKEKKKFITSKCRAESILDKKTPLGNKQKRRCFLLCFRKHHSGLPAANFRKNKRDQPRPLLRNSYKACRP
ncbi:MAG: hypothetical protein ACLTNK_04030, partial [Akkermansia muciniphila]